MGNGDDYYDDDYVTFKWKSDDDDDVTLTWETQALSMVYGGWIFSASE